jgi:hypothetical protein
LVPSMAEFDLQSDVVRFLITWVLTALFIHFAAKIVLDRGGFIAALLVALVGTLLAVFVSGLVGGTLGLVLAIVTWALVCAIFYRTSWLKGAVVGLVAWVLFFVVSWVVRKLLAD